jgi:hypothetical protein
MARHARCLLNVNLPQPNPPPNWPQPDTCADTPNAPDWPRLDDRVPGAIAVWMGQFTQGRAAFDALFVDMHELGSGSPIQRALNTSLIDPDWFIAHLSERDLPVAELARELDCHPGTAAHIAAAAQAKGLQQANALFFHVDARFEEAQPGRYAGLLFIGKAVSNLKCNTLTEGNVRK